MNPYNKYRPPTLIHSEKEFYVCMWTVLKNTLFPELSRCSNIIYETSELFEFWSEVKKSEWESTNVGYYKTYLAN